ncbi:hypothetical protein PIB30_016119 [Stylosanthes scabra]|uniref:Uncharacterized protein n=1 Tax=Stylosanthes scabra TaxID=79078 RepID=A0ABU6R7J5_9FABA|nr:hypothetical protein [Stylosanthes scabra]
MDAARALRLDPASSGKYHVSRMTTTHRLLLYVISRILMPRKSNHGSATEEDLILLWAMINERQINWPYVMAHKLVEYSHGKVNSALGLPHLWGKVFPLIPLDVLQEEFVASKPEFAITSKNINQMRRDLANPDGAEEDVPERNVRPRTDVGSSSQVPRETGESSQSQPNFMEIMLKSFEALQARVDMKAAVYVIEGVVHRRILYYADASSNAAPLRCHQQFLAGHELMRRLSTRNPTLPGTSPIDEGFAKITDRIDSIDISLISQAEEMRMLRDRFLELVGEVPPTTEPTVEVPTETAPTVEVPSTDPLGVGEVTRTDDPAAEDGTEVAPVVADQGEGVQAATETTEVVQEQPVEAPVQD